MSDDTVELAAADGEPQRSVSTAHAELPGRILASKRAELNWSIEDVAHSLHLAPRQIIALEEDNYSALPGRAITRGFIRSYAKLLKLDHEPLLQMIPNETNVGTENASLRRALPAKPFYANSSLNLSTSPRSWVRAGVLFVLVLAVIAVIASNAGWLPASWIGNLDKWLSAQVTSDSGQEKETRMLNATLEQKVAVQETSPSSLTATAAIQPEVAAKPSSDESSIAPEVGTSGERSNAVTAEARIHSSDKLDNKDLLVLKLREESWIEVRDARNKVILSRLAKAGESKTISVREPIKLKIGNAAGVDAQLRGVPVELAASAKNNIARLTVN